MNRIIICISLIVFIVNQSFTQENLQLKSVFSTTENCHYKTKGIFVAWWDKAFDYGDKADELLETLVDVQDDCLNTYRMVNPPNPIDGYYYNVYIHNGRDLFPDGWAMGQGTDSNGYPFLTIPIGYANLNNAGLQHEGFHIFQYNANSPGFAYSGDSQWYIEATANWYAALKHPDSPHEYVTASCITYNPQVPMWYTFNNREDNDVGSWVRYCHQYGMNILINYLTDVKDISPRIFVDGFFAETNELPQEYLYKEIGPDNFRELFADYTAHNVGGFEHFPAGTEARTYQELATYGDLNDTHPTVETFQNEGTDGDWIEPKNDWVTRAWAYNVYKIENTEKARYTFHLAANQQGEFGDPAEFRGRIVIRKENKNEYYDLEMEDLLHGSYTLEAEVDDEEIYLVIVSVPHSFRGNQKFRYQVKIDYTELTGVATVPSQGKLGANYPNPFSHETCIPYELANTSDVSLRVSNLIGKTVLKRNFLNMPAGRHKLFLSAKNLKPGIYLYHIRTSGYGACRVMVVE